MESLQAENSYIVKTLDRNQFESVEKLHELHALLDPSGSIKSVGKAFDQTCVLVRESINKMHSLVAQTDHSKRDTSESYAQEIRDLRSLNLAQAERIKELHLQHNREINDIENED